MLIYQITLGALAVLCGIVIAVAALDKTKGDGCATFAIGILLVLFLGELARTIGWSLWDH